MSYIVRAAETLTSCGNKNCILCGGLSSVSLVTKMSFQRYFGESCWSLFSSVAQWMMVQFPVFQP